MVRTRERARRKEPKIKTTDEKETEPYRRAVRFGYISLHHRINEERDEIASVNSENFASIINDVEKLHAKVVKPREQVADAEVLLGITNTLFTAAKSHSTVVSPTEFVSSLIRQFGVGCGTEQSENAANSIRWEDIGFAAARIFKKARGCLTMIGPMKNLELKQRKVTNRKYRPKLRDKPQEITDVEEENLSTDKNIALMFKILKKKKTVKLENLMLNRNSFAQTVENLFALSFLVKDGRVVVKVDDNGSHFVSPRNAPDFDSVLSGEAEYTQFVFRLDFPDWKLMLDLVPEGEELMPHRNVVMEKPGTLQEQEFESKDVQMALNSTQTMMDNLGFPVEEFELKVFEMASNATPATEEYLRNSGQLLPEKSMAKDMLETQNATKGNRNVRRKLF